MGQGKDSYWQLAEEVTPGTFVPAVAKSEMIQESIGIDIDEIPDPSLYAARSPRGVYQGARRAKGNLELRMNYEGGWIKLIKAALGSSSSALVASETVVRDHTIKEGTTLPSLSLEISKGDIPTGKILRGSGFKVPRLTLRGGVGTDAMARAEAEFLGIDFDPNTGATPAGYTPTTTITVSNGGGSSASPTVTCSGGSDFIAAGVRPGMAISGTGIAAGAVVVSITSATSITVSINNSGAVSGVLTFTLAFPTLAPIIGTQVITLINGVDTAGYNPASGTALRARRWSVTIENPLAERLYLGSAQPDTPLLSGQLKVTWEIEEEFQTLKAYQAARLYTTTSPKIILSPKVQIGTQSTTYYEFELRSNTCNCKYSNPVEGYGVVVATSTHTASFDNTDQSALVCRVRSLDPAV
jgi:hypothetical protein